MMGWPTEHLALVLVEVFPSLLGEGKGTVFKWHSRDFFRGPHFEKPDCFKEERECACPPPCPGPW